MLKQHIQLFTKGEDFCEIDDELVSCNFQYDCVFVMTKDENGAKWEHIFPLRNVNMIRISRHEGK